MTGQFFGANIFQSPYRNISGVEVKFHLLTGYLELSAGGVQNLPKSYWAKDKNSDPAKAPNCISLSSRIQADKFRKASDFIMSKLSADVQGSRELHAPSPEIDVLAAIEKLGQLKASGVLSEAEFVSKKAELLARL